MHGGASLSPPCGPPLPPVFPLLLAFVVTRVTLFFDVAPSTKTALYSPVHVYFEPRPRSYLPSLPWNGPGPDAPCLRLSLRFLLIVLALLSSRRPGKQGSLFLLFSRSYVLIFLFVVCFFQSFLTPPYLLSAFPHRSWTSIHERVALSFGHFFSASAKFFGPWSFFWVFPFPLALVLSGRVSVLLPFFRSGTS